MRALAPAPSGRGHIAPLSASRRSSRKRKRLALLLCWIVLLASSHLVQRWRRQPASPRPGQRVVTVTAQSASGPVPGRTVTLAYTDRGEGPPLVLLHGSPGAASNFDRLIPHLEGRLRLIAPDLPGFGASTAEVPDYGIRAYARYVLALMDALDVPRAHVLGFSLGSGVALELADLAPERVESLIFYGGVGVQEAEGSGSYAFEHFKYRVGYASLVLLPDLLPHFGLLGSRISRKAFLRNFLDTDQRPLRGILKRLKEPLLLLHGHHDPLVPLRAAREHHRLVHQSQLVLFDASHFMLFSDQGAAKLATQILPFVLDRERGRPLERRTLDYAPQHTPRFQRFRPDRSPHPWRDATWIGLAAVCSPEAALLATGGLVRELRLDFFVAYVGWVLGALGWVALAGVIGVGLRRTGRVAAPGWALQHPWLGAFVVRMVPLVRLSTGVAVSGQGWPGFGLFARYLLLSLFWPLAVLVAGLWLDANGAAQMIDWLIRDGAWTWPLLLGTEIALALLLVRRSAHRLERERPHG